MKRGRHKRRNWMTLIALAGACAVATACSQSQAGALWSSSDWYGYYYENVMANSAPALSRPFPSANACLTAMRAYTGANTGRASRWAGFACGKGCRQEQNGVVAGCSEVVH